MEGNKGGTRGRGKGMNGMCCVENEETEARDKKQE